MRDQGFRKQGIYFSPRQVFFRGPENKSCLGPAEPARPEKKSCLGPSRDGSAKKNLALAQLSQPGEIRILPWLDGSTMARIWSLHVFRKRDSFTSRVLRKKHAVAPPENLALAPVWFWRKNLALAPAGLA